MEKSISVAVLNYNGSKFIENRIQSIIFQTRTPREIIVLDDCSSDNSLELAENLLIQSKIPFKIIKNSVNEGVYSQWVKAFEYTTGDYLWIAEIDDYCENDFLECMYRSMSDDVIISYCKSKFVDQFGCELYDYPSYLSRYIKNINLWENDFSIDGKDAVKNYFFIMNVIPNVGSVLFNKRLVSHTTLKKVKSWNYNGDWFFYVECLSSKYKLKYLNRELNYFVRHEGSIYGKLSHNKRAFDELIKIVDYIKLLVGEINDEDSLLNMIVDNLLYWDLSIDSWKIIKNLFNDDAIYKLLCCMHNNHHLITTGVRNALNKQDLMIKERDKAINSMDVMIKKRDTYIIDLERKLNDSKRYIQTLLVNQVI